MPNCCSHNAQLAGQSLVHSTLTMSWYAVTAHRDIPSVISLGIDYKVSYLQTRYHQGISIVHRASSNQSCPQVVMLLIGAALGVAIRLNVFFKDAASISGEDIRHVERYQLFCDQWNDTIFWALKNSVELLLLATVDITDVQRMLHNVKHPLWDSQDMLAVVKERLGNHERAFDRATASIYWNLCCLAHLIDSDISEVHSPRPSLGRAF